MKRNNLLFILIVLLSSCSRSNKSPTLISQLEKNASVDEKITARAVANIDGSRCLKDVFTVDQLKLEIKELEKKYSSGTPVKGKWKHLNLESLPIAQANFLKTYGDRIGDLSNPNAFDYSSCSDVPCLFNKIYGREDHVAGYVHYLWYLKMGNLLAATNNVFDSKSQTRPGIYNGKNFSVSSYLYQDDELYGFWRLLMMMKAPHTVLRDLKEIHRVPQGESFDFVVEKRKAGMSSYGETCGLAYSNGYIILQDLCLGLYGDWESGDFYDSVLHELSHQVDYHEGRKLRKTYRSDQKDYLDVSFFYLKEYRNEKNELIRQWEHKEGIKLVTGYAGTSPAENFAETIAHFRVNGSNTKKSISEDHWQFISKNYFDNKSFESEKLIKEWLAANSSLLTQKSFQAVGSCAKNEPNYSSTYFQKTDFMLPLLPAMLSCLGSKAQDISSDLRSQIKVTDPDGCKTLTDSEIKKTWEPQLKLQLVQLMTNYLKELQTDKTYFAKIQNFIDEIPNRDMAYDAYLSCADMNIEDSCYEESVIKQAMEKLAPLNLPAGHAQDLADLYLAGHPINETKIQLTSYYKTYVSSHKSLIDLEAGTFWNHCNDIPLSDDASPSGKNFTLSEGYMASSIYNCLNSGFGDEVKIIVSQLAIGEMKIEHPKEEYLISQEVISELKKSLLALFSKARDKEFVLIKNYIEQDNGSLRKQIVSDFSWVKDVLSNMSFIKDCQRLALSKITFALRFGLKGESFGAFAESACKDVPTSDEYSHWLEQSKNVFREKSLVSLETRILDLANVKAKSCLVQFPVDSNLNRIKFKKEREACLINDWGQIENDALKEFEKDPMVIKFKLDIQSMRSQLDTNRRRLQLRVMKDNFQSLL
jgi:hypothetical protein